MHKHKKYAALAATAIAAGIAAFAIGQVINDGTFVPNDQPVGYVAQPVASTLNVAGGDAKMFTSDYDARDWTGNLHKYDISADGVIGTTDRWGGGAEARLATVAASDRKIVTINAGAGVEFKWATLSNTQKAAIDAATATTATSSPLLNYLRGDKSNEGAGDGKFRVRNASMGDIIHSTPVVWNDGVNSTVFVGANDGMLHAIDTETGNERFAYVPNAVIPNLKKLAVHPYVHQYFVDGRMDVRHFDEVSKTMLVGLLGAGGQGIFGLDVTNLGEVALGNATGTVKWEKTPLDSDYAELGYTYGAPTLFNLAADKQAVVVGNGYNSANGKAVLYLMDAVNGSLIRSYTVSVVGGNGLSSPSIWDTNGDGFQDVAYAGDLKGNLWKFDLTRAATPVLLHSGGGVATAITMAPAVMKHPVSGQMVAFVTGRFLNALDSEDSTTLHYAYGIWDGAGASLTNIVEQTLTEREGPDEMRVRTATSVGVNWATDKGWKTRLLTGGERVAGDGAFILNGVFQFFSTNPTSNPTGTPRGENWWMQLNALTGGAISEPVFDLNGDRRFGAEDMIDLGASTTSGRYLAPVGRYMGGGVRSQLIGLTAKGVDIYHSNFDRNGAPRPPTTTVTERTVGGSRGVDGGHFDTSLFCFVNCGSLAPFYYRSGEEILTGYYRSFYPPDNSGIYSFGTEEKNAARHTSEMKHVHVHEYDDMYDKLGQSYDHPSQDRQRLLKTKAATSQSTVDTPSTATLEASNAFPPGATTAAGSWANTSTVNKTSAPSAVPTTYDYTEGEAASFSETNSSTTASVTVTRTTLIPVTMIKTEYRNVVNSKGRYDRQYKTTKYTWTMTRVDTATYPNFEFKVLVMNQAMSPAVNLRIVAPGSPVAANYNGSVLNYQAGTTLNAVDLPKYKIGSISDIGTNMPLDAFTKKDWGGTGDVRVGVHPVLPRCVGVANKDGMTMSGDAWRNGALTVQIVDSSIVNDDIERNGGTGARMGFRLKPAKLKTKLIAEYLIYWHHPSGACYGDSTWTKIPDADPRAGSASSIPMPNTLDPHGEFTHEPGTIPVKPTTPPPPVVTTAEDGTVTTVTVTYEDLAGGGYIERTTTTTVPPTVAGGGVVTGGAVSVEGVINTGGATRNRSILGRINWRELQK